MRYCTVCGSNDHTRSYHSAPKSPLPKSAAAVVAEAAAEIADAVAELSSVMNVVQRGLPVKHIEIKMKDLSSRLRGED